jgi:hypothetical protein
MGYLCGLCALMVKNKMHTMRLKPIFIFLMTSLCCLFSCTMDTDDDVLPTPNTPTPAIDYLPMSKGNYWIYELYAKANNQSEYVATGVFDTVVSLGDTLIQNSAGGALYKALKTSYGFDAFGSSKGLALIFRDSSEVLLYRFGDLMLSTSDSTVHEYFRSNEVVQTIQMKLNEKCIVPSGTYSGIYAENKILEVKNNKVMYQGSRCFVKGIGIVKEVVNA